MEMTILVYSETSQVQLLLRGVFALGNMLDMAFKLN